MAELALRAFNNWRLAACTTETAFLAWWLLPRRGRHTREAFCRQCPKDGCTGPGLQRLGPLEDGRYCRHGHDRGTWGRQRPDQSRYCQACRNGQLQRWRARKGGGRH